MNDQVSTQHRERQDEAFLYAFMLDWGSRIGLGALVISFGAYIFGLLPAHVPLEQLPQVWGLPAKAFLEQTQTPTGWGWLALASRGDLSNLIGIALLAGCSLPPLIALIPWYLRRRDLAYAVICAGIALVLLLAASGTLTGGH